MRTFCTIITSNYFPYALTLYSSLQKLNAAEQIHVLVCDDEPLKIDIKQYPNIYIHKLTDIFKQYNADLIIKKYSAENTDALRWSLKPVFISWLLSRNFSKVIYTDCDIFFFTDYEFIFTQLNNCSLLLTPGRTTRNPAINEEEFLSGFKYGLFNAGFIGATSKSITALKWWSDCCLYKIETNFEQGLFVDQKYLDAMPVLFDDIGIVRHKGCNIAFWNQHECNRTVINGKILINEKYPIIFIHFTNNYIPELLSGNDPLLFPLFKEYEKCFEQTGHKLDEFISELPEYKKPKGLTQAKHKLLVRTRIKRWLFKLSQKL